MNIIDSLLQEFTYEAGQTRKTLERAPEDKFGWKPHEKSMTLGQLVSHLAETPGWVVPTLEQTQLVFDMEKFKPWTAASTAELLSQFDSKLIEAQKAMKGVSNDHLMQPWALYMGDHKLFELPRVTVLRSMILNHSVHHRGQLTVYLRLLGIPVPSIYGPSADEQG